MKYKILSAILLSGIGLTGLLAQESVNSSGGSALGAGGSTSYSVGQIACQTRVGTNGSIEEGVQQSYQISVVTTTKEAKDINLSVSAYPNPTSDYFTLDVKGYDFSNLTYQLYDMNGRLLLNKKITSNLTSIEMSNLISATYYVKVTDGNQEVKTFKIIKR